MKHNKIFIIGTMGSGKTTLAERLSKELKIRHYGLDDVYYSKKYTKKRKEDVRERKLNELLKKKKWIIEGVFNNWTEEIFKKADLVVWLDLNPHYVVRQLLKRLFLGKKDEKINIREQWASMKYAVKYRKGTNKFNYHKSMVDKHKPNLVHIKTRKELNTFLRGLE